MKERNLAIIALKCVLWQQNVNKIDIDEWKLALVDSIFFVLLLFYHQWYYQEYKAEVEQKITVNKYYQILQ